MELQWVSLMTEEGDVSNDSWQLFALNRKQQCDFQKLDSNVQNSLSNLRPTAMKISDYQIIEELTELIDSEDDFSDQ
jgi:hypothetical protein